MIFNCDELLSRLDQLHINSQTLQFFDQNVERLRQAGIQMGVSLDDRFIHAFATLNIIRLYRKHFLQSISGTIGL